MQIPKWHNIRGHTESFFVVFFFCTKIESKKHFTCFFRQSFNHFIYIPSFSLRLYLVLAESKIEKQFSSQIDLHCGFLRRCR